MPSQTTGRMQRKDQTLQKAVPRNGSSQKQRGAYYTPPEVARMLVRSVIQRESDRLLDPSCGDGRFLSEHTRSVGIDFDAAAVAASAQAAPHARIHAADFFEWASATKERFDCAAGNPPFIRYQKFNGATQRRSQEMCAKLGVKLTGLSSSWPSFLVVAASLLKPGGRMAFVVPSEIGHAPYARPLLEFLLASFTAVQIVAIREKVFPELSEDVWLLRTAGYRGSADAIELSVSNSLRNRCLDKSQFDRIERTELDEWNGRLRPFLLPSHVRELYRASASHNDSYRIGDVARVGIGYVTGDNDFFHLRPSEAKRLRIPKSFLLPTIRKTRFLPIDSVDDSTIDEWMSRDEPALLLRIPPDAKIPNRVRDYLESKEARCAQQAYKCRKRTPWYSVPDVRIPDAFLTYMNGIKPSLVVNRARCSCTNSIHAMHLNGTLTMSEVQRRWRSPLVELSCELEGHPLGGGMLKLEPREAARVILPSPSLAFSDDELESLAAAANTMRRWRHYG